RGGTRHSRHALTVDHQSSLHRDGNFDLIQARQLRPARRAEQAEADGLLLDLLDADHQCPYCATWLSESEDLVYRLVSHSGGEAHDSNQVYRGSTAPGTPRFQIP